MDLALLVQQERTVTGHAHQYVPGALFLQGAGGGSDVGVGGKGAAHDLTQLMMIGLDEEGVILQHIHQQVAGRVHHRMHTVAFQTGQQTLVGGLGQAGRDAPRQNEDVALGQLIELCFQLLHGALGDVRACAVQLSLLPRLYLDVDAGHALLEVDKVGGDALRGQTPLEPRTRLTSHKAQRRVPAAQLGQHTGHVDALAAQHAVLAFGAVHLAHFQRRVQPHDVVDGRVECHGIDHSVASFTRVNCLYFGFGQ